MASKKIEDEHSLMLKQLLMDYGLECQRSVSVSIEEEEELEPEVEDEIVVEEEPAIEEAVVEEKPEIIIEEEVEEVSREFPTPSLRRVIPEKLRRIEAQNRIHVLPDTFAKEINPALIPKINSTAQQKYIDILADMVGCTKYKSNMAEYWFLDTLANLLRRAQEDEMHRSTQAILILWFCEWMKEMQQFDAADRERMLKRWKDNMLSAARTIAEEEFLPTPKECGVYYSVQDLDDVSGGKASFTSKHKQSKIAALSTSNNARSTLMNVENSKQVVDFADNAYECSLHDLTKITHYIYDLFSTDYQYDLVRSIFCFTPEYRQIDPQFQLRVPKRMYAPLKTKATKSPKKEKPKSGKGKKQQEPDSDEYILLMQFMAKDLKQQEEQDERDREDWNKRSHILPLNFAATEELFNMYWPPPPPELVVELPPPEKPVKPVKGKK